MARLKKGDKGVRYRKHAQDRMRERHVSPADVVRTLSSPDAVRSAQSKKARRFEKVLSTGRRLTVIAEDTPLQFWVVTVFWS